MQVEIKQQSKEEKIMKHLESTLTSLEVAEMVGREHYDVMKDVRRIVSHLGEGTSSFTYFIESEYADSQGKERPAFKLTKKGCELYSKIGRASCRERVYISEVENA